MNRLLILIIVALISHVVADCASCSSGQSCQCSLTAFSQNGTFPNATYTLVSGTDTCPFELPGGSDSCSQRQGASFLQPLGSFCPPAYRVVFSLEVFGIDVGSRIAAVVLGSLADSINYFSCRSIVPIWSSNSSSSCIAQNVAVDSSVAMLFLQCLSSPYVPLNNSFSPNDPPPPYACRLRYSFNASCTYWGSSQLTLLASISLPLHISLLVASLILLFSPLRPSRPAALLVVVFVACCGLLAIPYWATLILQARVFWTDSSASDWAAASGAMLSACGLCGSLAQTCLLYLWTHAWHRALNPVLASRLRYGFIVLAVLEIGAAVTSITLQGVWSNREDNLLQAQIVYLSMEGFLSLVVLALNVALLVYASLLLRGAISSSSGSFDAATRSSAIQLIIICTVLVISNSTRLALGIWYVVRVMQPPSPADPMIIFPGGSYFDDVYIAVVWHAFYVSLTLTIPYLCILAVMASSAQRARMGPDEHRDMFADDSKGLLLTSTSSSLTSIASSSNDDRMIPLLEEEKDKYDI